MSTTTLDTHPAIAIPPQPVPGRTVKVPNALARIADPQLGARLQQQRERRQLQIDREEAERLAAFLKHVASRD
jgi:hypothetical protein